MVTGAVTRQARRARMRMRVRGEGRDWAGIVSGMAGRRVPWPPQAADRHQVQEFEGEALLQLGQAVVHYVERPWGGREVGARDHRVCQQLDGPSLHAVDGGAHGRDVALVAAEGDRAVRVEHHGHRQAERALLDGKL